MKPYVWKIAVIGWIAWYANQPAAALRALAATAVFVLLCWISKRVITKRAEKKNNVTTNTVEVFNSHSPVVVPTVMKQSELQVAERISTVKVSDKALAYLYFYAGGKIVRKLHAKPDSGKGEWHTMRSIAYGPNFPDYSTVLRATMTDAKRVLTKLGLPVTQ